MFRLSLFQGSLAFHGTMADKRYRILPHTGSGMDIRIKGVPYEV